MSNDTKERMGVPECSSLNHIELQTFTLNKLTVLINPNIEEVVNLFLQRAKGKEKEVVGSPDFGRVSNHRHSYDSRYRSPPQYRSKHRRYHASRSPRRSLSRSPAYMRINREERRGRHLSDGYNRHLSPEHGDRGKRVSCFCIQSIPNMHCNIH